MEFSVELTVGSIRRVILLVGSLIGFSIFSLILGVFEYFKIRTIDFPVVLQRKNLIAVMLKLIAILYCIISIVLVVIVGVLLSEIVYWISIGIAVGIHILYLVVLTVLDNRYSKDLW